MEVGSEPGGYIVFKTNLSNTVKLFLKVKKQEKSFQFTDLPHNKATKFHSV